MGTAGVVLAPSLLSGCKPNEQVKDDFKTFIWVGNSAEKTMEDWVTQFTRIKSLGFDGVFAGGDAETLDMTASIAKSMGLEIHSWQWVMNRPGNKEAMAHPEWYAVSRKGESSLDVNPYVGYYQWLCPTKLEVQEYIIQDMMSIAEIADVDGVQLDYVRYCDVILPRGLWDKYNLVQDHEMPEFDFCYCDDCQSKFKAEHGYDILSIEDPTQDQAWRQFRYDSITNLVNRIAVEVHAKNKKLSASVFATPTLARKYVRQAWDEWDLDFVMPMVYYKMYAEDVEFVKTASEEGVAVLAGSKPLYTAQYLHDKTNVELQQTIEMAKAGGAQGMAFYDYGLLNKDFGDIVKNIKTS